jgi:hypothetical protein
MTEHGWGDALYVRTTRLADIVRRLTDEVSTVRAERDALRASTSWRVTRPLRSLEGALRRFRRS